MRCSESQDWPYDHPCKRSDPSCRRLLLNLFAGSRSGTWDFDSEGFDRTRLDILFHCIFPEAPLSPWTDSLAESSSRIRLFCWWTKVRDRTWRAMRKKVAFKFARYLGLTSARSLTLSLSSWIEDSLCHLKSFGSMVKTSLFSEFRQTRRSGVALMSLKSLDWQKSFKTQSLEQECFQDGHAVHDLLGQLTLIKEAKSSRKLKSPKIE